MSRRSLPRVPEDDDPTGIHALLSSLPEPGPMPADISARISASLEREAAERAAGGADQHHPWPVRAGSRWRRPQRIIGLAAAAAAVGVITIAAMQGVFGKSSATTSAAGTADLTYASSAAAKPSPAAAAARAGTLGPEAGVLGELKSDVTPDLTPAPTKQSNHSKTEDPIHIRLSSIRYTTTGLLKQAVRLAEDHSTATLRPGAAEAVTIGPIGTPLGVSSCLTSLGLAGSSRTVVDLASFDGHPAAILITTINGRSEARVVQRSCGAEGSTLIAGPVVLP